MGLKRKSEYMRLKHEDNAGATWLGYKRISSHKRARVSGGVLAKDEPWITLEDEYMLFVSGGSVTCVPIWLRATCR